MQVLDSRSQEGRYVGLLRGRKKKRRPLRPVAVGEGGCEVHLLAVRGRRVPVIEVLRRRMDLRLGAAYEVVEEAPTIIGRHLETDVAEGFAAELREAGASVEVLAITERRLRVVE
jgi:ribosomal protein L7/L12